MYAFDYTLEVSVIFHLDVTAFLLGACFGSCEKYMQYMHTLWQGYSNVGDGICNYFFYLIINKI